ncbi:MAG TPA: potassium-transporting ATPase subunit C [Gemmatimonadaceae bacterium]|nr:potassium-transporting ATPase subunit C [Gemmatimonadaceae bacterium]
MKKLQTLLSSLALRRHTHLTDAARTAPPPPPSSFADGRIAGSISPFNALLQIPRIARARGVPVATLHALVADHTTVSRANVGRAPRVDVRALNAALEATVARRARVQFAAATPPSRTQSRRTVPSR